MPEAAGLTPPPDADKLVVTVGHVDVAGTFPGFEQKTAAIMTPLNGNRVSVARIYDLANDLERAYADAGYFLARVVIPKQDLTDGSTLHIAVIDGVIERVDLKGIPEAQQSIVMGRMAALVGVHHLQIDEMERHLLLVSDLPGLQVRSTLGAGDAPGSTLVVLEGKQTYVTGTFGVDNRLPSSLGTVELNGSAALNDVTGYGEQIYFSMTTSPELAPARLRVLGGGFSLPLGDDGLTINPEYTKSQARPIPPLGVPATQGDFDRFAFRANYPVIRGRTTNLVLQGSLEWQSEQLTPIGFQTRFYLDDYEVARLRATYTFQLGSDVPVQVSGALSQGLAGRSPTATLPLSRLGAGPVFTAALFEAGIQYPLPESLLLSVTGRAQSSFDTPLMLAEQFSLDGTSGVSAFAAGTFSVDQGASLRAEISRPLSLPIFGQSVIFSPYVFAAGGWGELVQPTALEHRDIGAGAAGIGLRTDSSIASLLGASLAFEFAKKFSDVPSVPSGYRTNLSLNLRF